MNKRFMEQFYNIPLEADVLGVMLSYGEQVNDGMMLLDIDCFSEVKHKTIYSAIKKLWDKSKTVDISTVYNIVSKEITLGYLTELLECGLRVGFKEKCNELIKYKQRFQLYKLINKANDMFKQEADFNEIISSLNDHTEMIISQRKTNKIYNATEILSDGIENLDDRRKKGGGISGISTGFSELDNAINGLRKKEMVIIAGSTSMGKSTFVNNIAINVAKENKYVAMFSLEMAKEQIAEKLLSTITLIEADKIAKAKVSGIDIDDMKRTINANKYLENFLIFDDITSLNSIKATCKMLKKKNKLDVMIVDYMQLIGTGVNKNREQEVAYISRQLKELSSDLGITVIALSQLSRDVGKRVDKRPIPSDLRESGAIEQDANTIIMCYRDEYYNYTSENKGIFEAIVVKNRGGANKTVKLAWIPEYQKIATLDVIHKPTQERWEEDYDNGIPF